MDRVKKIQSILKGKDAFFCSLEDVAAFEEAFPGGVVIYATYKEDRHGNPMSGYPVVFDSIEEALIDDVRYGSIYIRIEGVDALLRFDEENEESEALKRSLEEERKKKTVTLKSGKWLLDQEEDHIYERIRKERSPEELSKMTMYDFLIAIRGTEKAEHDKDQPPNQPTPPQP